MYTTLKFLHLLGVVLLVGNIIVTALWKTLADRSGNPATVAFAQRTVALADWVFTLPGVLLVLIGGWSRQARRGGGRGPSRPSSTACRTGGRSGAASPRSCR